MSQRSCGNESTHRLMALLASLWHAAERLIQQPRCPAAGSVTHTRTHTSSHQYYMMEGTGAREADIVLFQRPRSLFNFCPLLLFFKLSLWRRCSLLECSHLLQLRLDGESSESVGLSSGGNLQRVRLSLALRLENRLSYINDELPAVIWPHLCFTQQTCFSDFHPHILACVFC